MPGAATERNQARFRRRRLWLLAGAVAVLVAVRSVACGSSLPLPSQPGSGPAVSPGSGDLFAYATSRAAQFTARATAGSQSVLFTKSPGGALKTAARVAAFRGQIDAAARGTGIDPALVEGMVYVESAGRPYVVAGSDPSAAAGLTQILAGTGTALLGMHIDLTQSRTLSRALAAARSPAQTRTLLGRLAAVDERFDPRRALAATVRYLRLAARRFGREDLAVVSYHMGIGNLQHVLDTYGTRGAPYVQLYFDTQPDRHASAYRLLSGFGDQSSMYFWRVLGAVQVMRLYRSDKAALARLAALQVSPEGAAAVLHPPQSTKHYADSSELARAYSSRALVALPKNLAGIGFRLDPSVAARAHTAGAPPALYSGLAPAGLDLLSVLGARVRKLSGSGAPLTLAAAVQDGRLQSAARGSDPLLRTGFTFLIARRYASPAQAVALQDTLDRLQALNLIAWARGSTDLEVTVAPDAAGVISHGI